MRIMFSQNSRKISTAARRQTPLLALCAALLTAAVAAGCVTSVRRDDGSERRIAAEDDGDIQIPPGAPCASVVGAVRGVAEEYGYREKREVLTDGTEVYTYTQHPYFGKPRVRATLTLRDGDQDTARKMAEKNHGQMSQCKTGDGRDGKSGDAKGKKAAGKGGLRYYILKGLN